MDTQQSISPLSIYYVINMRNDHWVQISDLYLSLDEARRAYRRLLKDYPFARLGGSKKAAAKKET